MGGTFRYQSPHSYRWFTCLRGFFRLSTSAFEKAQVVCKSAKESRSSNLFNRLAQISVDSSVLYAGCKQSPSHDQVYSRTYALSRNYLWADDPTEYRCRGIPVTGLKACLVPDFSDCHCSGSRSRNKSHEKTKACWISDTSVQKHSLHTRYVQFRVRSRKI